MLVERGSVVDPIERDAILEDVLVLGACDLGPSVLGARDHARD